MFPQDLPQPTANRAAVILGCRFHSSADRSRTLLDHPVNPSRRQLRQLRKLRLSISQPQPGDQQLIHIWETYPAQLSPRPSTTSGCWTIENKTIVEDKPILYYDQLTPALHTRYIPQGRVTMLSKPEPDGSKQVWMSTSPLELATMSDSLEECRGNVLVAGLGMGLFPVLAAQKPTVQSITVIEMDPEIISLTEPYVRGPKVQIVQGDAWDIGPDELGAHKFDYCFFDTWPEIQDAFEDELAARRAVAPMMRPGSKTSVWCQLLNDRKRQTIAKIAQQGPAIARISPPDTTCYQCAADTVSDLEGLCPFCAHTAWRDHPPTAHLPFPVPPHALPEYRHIVEARHILDNLPQDIHVVLSQLTAEKAPTNVVELAPPSAKGEHP